METIKKNCNSFFTFNFRGDQYVLIEINFMKFIRKFCLIQREIICNSVSIYMKRNVVHTYILSFYLLNIEHTHICMYVCYTSTVHKFAVYVNYSNKTCCQNFTFLTMDSFLFSTYSRVNSSNRVLWLSVPHFQNFQNIVLLVVEFNATLSC